MRKLYILIYFTFTFLLESYAESENETSSSDEAGRVEIRDEQVEGNNLNNEETTAPPKPIFGLKNSWIGGFSGEINIPIKDEANGWKVSIRFYNLTDTIEDFQVYTAEVVEQSLAEGWIEYTLSNLEWNKQLEAGKRLGEKLKNYFEKYAKFEKFL